MNNYKKIIHFLLTFLRFGFIIFNMGYYAQTVANKIKKEEK